MKNSEIKSELIKISNIGFVGREILNEIAFHSDMCEDSKDSIQYRIWEQAHRLLAPENYPEKTKKEL